MRSLEQSATQARNWKGNTRLATFGYKELGKRVSVTRPIDLQSSYGYDAVGRLTSVTHNLAGEAADVSFALAYNAADEIITRTVSNPIYAWTGSYDPNDPNRVGINRGYAVNALNQLTRSGDNGLSYNGLGALTSDGTRTFGYDEAARLISAGPVGAAQAAFVFDGKERLWTSTPPGGETTTFRYSGERLISERTGSGAVTAWVPGPNVDEPMLWYVGQERRWLVADERGSIVAAANDNGSAIGINTYDDYGIPGLGNLTSAGLRFGYTGQVWLPEAGLWHYKARAYSPTLGRFLQPDPIGYKDSPNLYAYVKDDPLDHTDPTGMDTLVQMQWYPLGRAPIQGEFGHDYLYLFDTRTGESVISRAGPSSEYPRGSMSSNVISNTAQRDSRGDRITLVTTLTPASKSPDANKASTEVVPGGSVVLKSDIGDVKLKLERLNNAVDHAEIDYKPQSTNSNAYTSTAFTALTNKPAPTMHQLPGSNINLRPSLAECRGMGNGC